MIRKIQLKNFKCFNNCIFELSPFTILSGVNASGKSTIIQALLFAFYTAKENLKNGDTLDINKPYGFDLGKASNLRSHNPVEEINRIEISLASKEDDMEESKIFYNLDTSVQPSVLRVNYENIDLLMAHDLDYLRAERIGPRRFTSFSSEPFFQGYNGEYTSYVIEQADLHEYKINEKLVAQSSSKNKFSAQVETWLSVIIDNTRMQFNNSSEFGLMQNYMQNSVSKEPVLPTATGFGFSYALPIVVGGLLASGKKDSLFIVENPEAHLHPSAQSNMGKFLALLASIGVQVVVETHSEHIIDGARIQLANDKEVDKLKIAFFHSKDGEIDITDIKLRSNGELTEWPEKFFDQRQIDLRALLEIKRNGSTKYSL